MQSREAIAQEWLGRVLPGAGFGLASGGIEDPFRNPVGYTLRQAVGILLDELFSTMDRERVRAALDSIVQIRAVQDLTPGQALEFLFQLKPILRRRVGFSPRGALAPQASPVDQSWESGAEAPRGLKPTLHGDPELDLLLGRIDELALVAFDLYMKYRERTFEARAHEARRRVYVLERRFEMQEAK